MKFVRIAIFLSCSFTVFGSDIGRNRTCPELPPQKILPVWVTECQWSECQHSASNGRLNCDLMRLRNHPEGKLELQNSTRDGCEPEMTKVECCLTFRTDCQWSDCHGLTTPGQLMCDLKGPRLSRTIKSNSFPSDADGYGCGWDSSRVICCPSNDGDKRKVGWTFMVLPFAMMWYSLAFLECNN